MANHINYPKQKEEDKNKTIFIIGITIISLFLIYTLTRKIPYGHLLWKYDAIAALLLTFILYSIKGKIKLLPPHYLLFEIFLVTHLLGVFGAYTIKIGLFEYDMLMHGFFGFVAALILLNKYRPKALKKEWLKYLKIIIIILSFSALHEITEHVGGIMIGKGEGFLGFGPGDFGEFDTQIDLIMNLVGILAGISLYTANKLAEKQK